MLIPEIHSTTATPPFSADHWFYNRLAWDRATNFLNNQSYDSSKPKAFINWILFDEQFNFVSANSGFEQVGATDSYTSHTRTDEAISKSGYLYIYVSNETPNIVVFFDILQVTHKRGPMLSEDHYYPFGLTMSGISSKALSFGAINNRKFNGGVELDQDLGMDLYKTFFRQYDQQIGRFIGIDIRAEEGMSFTPYHFALNNPIIYNDPMGDKEELPTHIGQGFYRMPGGRIIGWGEMQWYLRGQGLLSEAWSSGGGSSSGDIISFGYGQSRRSGAEGFRIGYSFLHTPFEGKQNVGLGTQFLSFRDFHSFGNKLDTYFQRQENYTIWGTTIGIYGLAGSAPEHLLYSRITPKGRGWYLNEKLKFQKIPKGVLLLNASANSSRALRETIGKFTKPLGMLTTGISFVQTLDDINNGHYETATVHGGDAVMGLVAFWGPIGAGVSGLYFLSRFFWGD